MKRRVKGFIRTSEDLPWEGAVITFALIGGSYDQTASYPVHSQVLIADDAGFFSCELWCNEGGLAASTYRCSVNSKDIFTFTLPVGTDDIDLSVLRALGAKPFPTPIKPKRRENRQVFIPTTGQTVFVLNAIALNPHLSMLWLNGVKVNYPSDYTLDSTLLTWRSATRLEDTDLLEILYFVET